jgi:hypothetical protein
VWAYTRAVRCLLLCVSLAAALGLSVSAGPAESIGTSACTNAGLHGSFAEVEGSAGAGHIIYRLRLLNRTGATCQVPTHPPLHLEDNHRHGLPTNPTFAAASSPTFNISAHRAMIMRARFSPDIPSGGEPAQCERVAHWLRVGLLAHRSVTVPVEPPTRVCGHGAMTFSSLHQGS